MTNTRTTLIASAIGLTAGVAITLTMAFSASPAEGPAEPELVGIPGLTCEAGYIPGWLDGDGNATSCIRDGSPIVKEELPPALPLTPMPLEVPIVADTSPAPEVIMEDDPRWDCRTMGNLECGVEIQGTWYIITFANGAPISTR